MSGAFERVDVPSTLRAVSRVETPYCGQNVAALGIYRCSQMVCASLFKRSARVGLF
jgi:hypothetical protein